MPFNAREAAIVAADGEPFQIDAADVTDSTGRPARTMLACAGVGWDAHVVRALAENRKGHITFGTWLRPIASALRDYRFPRFRVTATSGADAGRVEEGVFAIALNCAPYAAFFLPEPAARPDDGLIDLLLVRNASALTMLRLAWKARRFGHRRNTRNTMANDGAVVTLRGRSFRIDGDTAVPYQIDGDVGGVTGVDILVRPRAIRLMRPMRTPEVSKNA